MSCVYYVSLSVLCNNISGAFCEAHIWWRFQETTQRRVAVLFWIRWQSAPWLWNLWKQNESPAKLLHSIAWVCRAWIKESLNWSSGLGVEAFKRASARASTIWCAVGVKRSLIGFSETSLRWEWVSWLRATPSISLFATPKASFATQAYILYSLTGND